MLITAPVQDPEDMEVAPGGNVARFPGVIGTFMGRDALALAVSYLALGGNDTVLLPVYTCQEVIRSFVKSTRVLFYDVTADLTIDPDEVRSKLKGSRVKMMLVTNYFGFLQPYRQEIKQICADKGICLIEDCAHSLLTEGSGETGDLSFYSFRKILPLPDGGGLRVNSSGQPPAPKYYPKIYSNAISVFITAKSAVNIRSTMLSRAGLISSASKVLPHATSPKRDDRILPLSYFASKAMASMCFPEIIERRRSDFQFWQEVSRTNDSLEPVFGNLPPGVCPLGFAINVKDRDILESRARTAGISLSVHWRLDPTLGIECSISHKLTGQLLTLPIYPELGQKKREILAGILARR